MPRKIKINNIEDKLEMLSLNTEETVKEIGLMRGKVIGTGAARGEPKEKSGQMKRNQNQTK